MPRIIVATTPQVGHVLPVLSLLPRLKEQGYDITLLQGPRQKNVLSAKVSDMSLYKVQRIMMRVTLTKPFLTVKSWGRGQSCSTLTFVSCLSSR
ncbi:Uncharacterised protein [Pseudomonas luteola]|uniref:Uncharacterized protein n=1 Tax=Pseudomonas luteola TaxID=47886 RepID=A0A2X2D9L2_PSELU|nr:Uncharacterised protein [Pseudomonas luteola]